MKPTETQSKKLNADLVVIGAGPASMAAALSAYKSGVKDILVLERGDLEGGILNQCIHNGFGLHYFKEELTGPEYAWRFKNEIDKTDISVKLNTMVIDISDNKLVTAVSKTDGVLQIQAKAVILGMGCRERTRGALNILGSRPSGIFTAGAAQLFVNMQGNMPGKEIVILGSGDIGLIMARRMTLEGAKVKAVCELMPFSGGLQRNIVQCLEDFDIPLLLSHTVVHIHGTNRVTGVTIAKVDEKLNPIEETFEYIPCDTLLLSVGLIPENELSQKAGIDIDPITSGPVVDELMETSIDGIFACGNVVHVHDLVDFVTLESERAGFGAALYLANKKHKTENKIDMKTKNGVRYVIPQKVCVDNIKDDLSLFFRVDNVYKNVRIVVSADGKTIKSVKKKHVAPGEMESLKLSKADIPSNTHEITLELVRED